MECAHESCTCSDAPVVEGGKNYCSEACASTDMGERCPCGHGECHGDDEA